MWIGVRFLTVARKPDGRNACRIRRVGFLTIRDDPMPWMVVFSWLRPVYFLGWVDINAKARGATPIDGLRSHHGTPQTSGIRLSGTPNDQGRKAANLAPILPLR